MLCGQASLVHRKCCVKHRNTLVVVHFSVVFAELLSTTISEEKKN